MNKITIILGIVILILIGAIGYLLFDLGVSKSNSRIIVLENQMAINTQNIGQIINFLNANAKK